MRTECEFCQGDGCIEDEYGEWKLAEVTIVPFPALDLDTGEYEKTAEPPYHVLFLQYLDDECGVHGEQGSFPIKYCPICGRCLEAPKKPLTPEEWIRKRRERNDKENK